MLCGSVGNSVVHTVTSGKDWKDKRGLLAIEAHTDLWWWEMVVQQTNLANFPILC